MNRKILPPLIMLLTFSQPALSLNLIGHVASNNPLNIVAEISGVVQQAKLELGDSVIQGQDLLTIQSQDFSLEVNKQQANLALSKADLKIKESIYKRYLQLQQQQSLSQNELDIASTDFDAASASLQLAEIGLIKAELDLDRTQITSSISGYISQRSIDNGSWVDRGTPLYQVVNIDTLTIRLLASEYEIDQLKIGQDIQLWSEANPNNKVTSTIKRIGIALVDNSFAYPVDVEINNPRHQFKPGMSMHATTNILDK
ncbi:efflux RND transporter periplasmic adaptor subunit [Moritella sp. 24]|uniref:efflux RND transporter periplasmic adaptor subunit n=1 Tax=Moritella sp. 24 TaxID=2746230 RepID=UPI001BA4D52D|nr:efflux RND transporter periplasmic adaptor subunit [Moritella sp. 24]QUM76258.1 efflux RND transporter periplasmic adaptor subunit [Moritella sp. 24]